MYNALRWMRMTGLQISFYYRVKGEYKQEEFYEEK